MLISRVAENCFWFGRYLERAEATARSLAETRESSMGAEFDDGRSWLPIVIAAGERERFAELHGDTPNADQDEELVQRYMVWEDKNPSSLRASVTAVRDNARTIRDHLSLEVWEQINELHLWLKQGGAEHDWDEDRHAFYDRISRSMALVAGLLRTTMLRAEPLDFIVLGTMLERAGQTARVLDVQHHALALSRQRHAAAAGEDDPPPAQSQSQSQDGQSQSQARSPRIIVDTARWLTLLRACGGYGPYMRRHRGRVSGKSVAAFLIQDPRFPRSVGFALDAAAGRLDSIRPAEAEKLPGERSQRRLAKLRSWLHGRSAEDLAGPRVHEVLTHVVDESHAICNSIGVELLGHPA